MITVFIRRRRAVLAANNSVDMVLLINSSNTGDFSVTTNYGTFMAVKVSEYSYFDTTVTHTLSIRGVTFSTGQKLSDDSAVRGLFVGVESWGTSNTCTNTLNLFYDCSKLRGIPSSWEGLGKLTTADSMFKGCTSLTGIPTSWEGLGKVTDANFMFASCTSLTSIPASWEGLGKVTAAIGMFFGCTSLASCGTVFTGLAMVTNVSNLFYGCTGMQGDIHALYVYLSTKPIAVSAFSACFRGCTQAVGYSSIPASWK
jgi:hypothetical protein